MSVAMQLDQVGRKSFPFNPNSPFDIDKVSGKTILITGGASGFGAAFAREWASHGANIVIGDLNDTEGENLVAELRTSSGSEHHHYQHCDVTDWQSQVNLFKFAAKVSPSGYIDAVVPNAGIANEVFGQGQSFENAKDLDAESPPTPVFKTLDVNLTGVMYTVHLAVFWMTATSPPNIEVFQKTQRVPKDRHILFVGSVAGLVPVIRAVQYTASKHAVTGLFRTLRGSAFRRGIRVNMLNPWFVETEILSNSVMSVLAGGGLGSVSDVVSAASRFMADVSIFGRAVVIGPRMIVEDGEDGDTTIVKLPNGNENGQGVWECYAHDYEHAEAFFYRMTKLMVMFALARGWIGWFMDLLKLTWRKPPTRGSNVPRA